MERPGFQPSPENYFTFGTKQNDSFIQSALFRKLRIISTDLHRMKEEDDLQPVQIMEFRTNMSLTSHCN
jgi:hypothetical protein